jgi:hypothetical protein
MLCQILFVSVNQSFRDTYDLKQLEVWVERGNFRTVRPAGSSTSRRSRSVAGIVPAL